MVKEAEPKIDWIEKAKEVHKYHVEQKRVNIKWRIQDTALFLKMGFGTVCEDLMIASWLKTHSVQIEKLEYRNEAIQWIREQKARIAKEALD